jgi:hypothetical protein
MVAVPDQEMRRDAGPDQRDSSEGTAIESESLAVIRFSQNLDSTLALVGVAIREVDIRVWKREMLVDDLHGMRKSLPQDLGSKGRMSLD